MNIELARVVAARHLGGHRVWLRFEDGLEGELELRDALRGPIFEPLTDAAFFGSFVHDGLSLTWPNGASLAPEFLYRRLLEARRSA